MTPSEILNKVSEYIGNKKTIICDLHSACSPQKGKMHMCTEESTKHVIDFDSVKTKADIERSIESRKSVDAITDSNTGNYLCFIELKSWKLLLTNNGYEEKIRKQAKKYESDLPQKLTESIEICKQICREDTALEDCKILFILVSDISTEKDGLADIQSNLSALAGSSSNLNSLCNVLSNEIMKNIPNIETRYWYCKDFDKKIGNL